MNSIDIGCHSSIGFSNSKGNEISEKIWVGNKNGYVYWSYLYFDLSDIPKGISLISATITLFKIPIESSQNHCYSPEVVNYYSVIPTVEYVTPYAYCYGIPHAEEALRSLFEVEGNLSYTEINMTEIIKAWMDDRIDNKGIMLLGEDKSAWVLYASELDKNKGLRPFLRIKYKGICCPYSEGCEPIIDLPISIKIISSSL